MRVCMFERFVNVDVGMGFGRLFSGNMSMLVMFIMHMPMFVLHPYVTVPMGMILGEMQPHPGAHQESGEEQGSRQWRAQGHGQCSADEGGQGKIGAGSGSTKIAQRQHEQCQTQAVTDEAD